ncbi:MAG TPA: nickel pincer cofactor biosynthesis protein LarB [Sedimentisphaerales bacterium]|nr:nickel pincer cofactor biosynthesis protein LarB [Sedimentisphaerales bacterium]
MNAEDLRMLLEKVKTGGVSIDQAIEKFRHMPFEDLGFAIVDHHRSIRCGAPEVIYCPNKTTEHIVAIFSALAKRGNNVLATRAGEDVYKAVDASQKYTGLSYDKAARAIVLKQRKLEPTKGFIVVITAGTADLAVAHEAKITAETMGHRVELISDVGVAGLHRLLHHAEILQRANAIVVVAGMEGALASVVGGLVSAPVIAVPTSVGYGANFGGVSALLTMLNSCASGVTVVNIDNGFSAGFTASLINSKINDANRQ